MYTYVYIHIYIYIYIYTNIYDNYYCHCYYNTSLLDCQAGAAFCSDPGRAHLWRISRGGRCPGVGGCSKASEHYTVVYCSIL